MIPVVATLAFASVGTFNTKLVAFAVLFGATWISTSTALYVSFNNLSIDFNCFDCIEALFVVILVLLKKVISFFKMTFVVEAICTSTYVRITKSTICKTITVKFQALRLLTITSRLIAVFNFFLRLRNFNFYSVFNFEVGVLAFAWCILSTFLLPSSWFVFIFYFRHIIIILLLNLFFNLLCEGLLIFLMSFIQMSKDFLMS